jgi:hypothetical protein
VDSKVFPGICEAPAPTPTPGVYWNQRLQQGPSELPHATEISWGPSPAELPAELPRSHR